jgi:hypothetical protein
MNIETAKVHMEKNVTVERTPASGKATTGMSEVIGRGKASVILKIQTKSIDS